MAKNRCRYCGKEIMEKLEFCSDDCRESYNRHTRNDVTKIGIFSAGVIIGLLTMFIGVFLSNPVIIGSGIILVGITILLLPFTTPETISILGYKSARIVGRVLGIVVIVVGIWVGYF